MNYHPGKFIHDWKKAGGSPGEAATQQQWEIALFQVHVSYRDRGPGAWVYVIGLPFLKVIDIRNGEQLKHSFTFIFRIFRGKTRTVWSVLREEKVYSEGKYQREKMQPWERVGSSRQAGNEKAQTGVHLPPGSWRGHVREVGAGGGPWNLARMGPVIGKTKQEQFSPSEACDDDSSGHLLRSVMWNS